MEKFREKLNTLTAQFSAGYSTSTLLYISPFPALQGSVA